MKYDGFKESSFIKIKNSNLINFIEFEYSIEQASLGKNIQAAFIRNYFKLFFNNIFSSRVSNIYYKNTNSISSIYSKNWWKI